MKLLKLRPQKREDLSVLPVARYGIPKYPSFEDPDPTKVPNRVPFPFRREVSIALAAAAIGCLDEATAIPVPAAPKSPEKSTQQPPVEVPKQSPPSANRSNPLPKSDELPRTSTQSAEIPKENPFLLSRSGLPHRTSPYGTNAPVPLTDEVARRVIEKVFSESGIELKSGSYTEHGLAFHIDGYDPKTKLGFVFGGREALDEDMILSWTRFGGPKSMLDERRLPLSDEAAMKKRWKRMINRAKGLTREERRTLEKKFVKSPFGSESETSERQSDLELELYAAEGRYARTAMNPEKLAYWEAQKLDKLSATKDAFIAVISSFDERFEVNARTQARFDTISPLADAKELRAAYDKFFEAAAQEQIARLEEEVRRYIAWARSQGL